MDTIGFDHTYGLPRLPLLFGSAALFVLAVVAGVTHSLAHEVAMAIVLWLLALLAGRQIAFAVLCLLPERMPASSDLPVCAHVTVIVPAHNEEAVIGMALASLDALEFEKGEIIVVNDGSTDQTLARAQEFVAAGTRHPVRILTQANSGKGAALNLGVQHAEGDFILCVDADSRLAPDAIKRAIGYFGDPKVGAVGGEVEIANLRGLLLRFQALEYAISLNFVRRALSRLGSVTVVPGPVGLFRRTALASVGGYPERRDAYAEDAELTLRLLGAGWVVKGAVNMTARTQAPATVFALLRQRYRWKRGLYQAFDANLVNLLSRPGFRPVAVALFLALECFVLDILNTFVLVFFVAHLIAYWEVQPLWLLYAVIVGLDFSVLLLLRRGIRRLPADLVLLALQRLTYSPLLQFWSLLALMDEWLSARMDWDKLERSVDQGPTA